MKMKIQECSKSIILLLFMSDISFLYISNEGCFTFFIHTFGTIYELKIFAFERENVGKRAVMYRVRNLKFATYLKFATCENTNKINELW